MIATTVEFATKHRDHWCCKPITGFATFLPHSVSADFFNQKKKAGINGSGHRRKYLWKIFHSNGCIPIPSTTPGIAWCDGLIERWDPVLISDPDPRNRRQAALDEMNPSHMAYRVIGQRHRNFVYATADIRIED